MFEFLVGIILGITLGILFPEQIKNLVGRAKDKLNK